MMWWSFIFIHLFILEYNQEIQKRLFKTQRNTVNAEDAVKDQTTDLVGSSEGLGSAFSSFSWMLKLIFPQSFPNQSWAFCGSQKTFLLEENGEKSLQILQWRLLEKNVTEWRVQFLGVSEKKC